MLYTWSLQACGATAVYTWSLQACRAIYLVTAGMLCYMHVVLYPWTVQACGAIYLVTASMWCYIPGHCRHVVRYTWSLQACGAIHLVTIGMWCYITGQCRHVVLHTWTLHVCGAIHLVTAAEVRFSGRLVANGAQKLLRATIFYYSGLYGNSKYLRSCNILDAAKINGMLINISEVLSWLHRLTVLTINRVFACVCDTFDIARNVAKP